MNSTSWYDLRGFDGDGYVHLYEPDARQAGYAVTRCRLKAREVDLLVPASPDDMRCPQCQEAAA